MLFSFNVFLFHFFVFDHRVFPLHVIDDIWMTCCAIHNRLLHADGLVAPSPGEGWDEAAGDFDEEDLPNIFKTLKGLDKAKAEEQGVKYDGGILHFGAGTSAGGGGSADAADAGGDGDGCVLGDMLEEAEGCDDERRAGDAPIYLRTFHELRDALVVHFNYKWHGNKIVWPRQNRKA